MANYQSWNSPNKHRVPALIIAIVFSSKIASSLADQGIIIAELLPS
jgi:hypothetical protein